LKKKKKRDPISLQKVFGTGPGVEDIYTMDWMKEYELMIGY
jgi:hypothetical protein